MQCSLQFLAALLGGGEFFSGGGFSSLECFLARSGLPRSTLTTLSINIGLDLCFKLRLVKRMLLFELRSNCLRLLALACCDLATDLFELFGRNFLFAPRARLAVDMEMRRQRLEERRSLRGLRNHLIAPEKFLGPILSYFVLMSRVVICLPSSWVDL
ncbi:MAG: hypothetical protein ACLP4V_33225 [Methylocella sp.]